MNIEARLTDALRAASAPGTPTPAGRDAALAAAAARRHRRLRTATTLAAAASVVVALGAFALLRDDPTSRVRTVPPVHAPSTDVPRTTLLPPTSSSTTAPPSPPERVVAVTSKGALLVVDAANGETLDLLAPPGSADPNQKPSVARRGTTVYFSKQGVDCGYPTLFEVPLDGSGGLRRLGNGGAPAVSPDGTRLAYSTPSNGCVGATLVVRELASGKEQRWEAPESDGYFSNGAITAIDWAPDGRRLAFQFEWEGSGVYLLDTQLPGRLDTARPLEPGQQPDNTSLVLRDWHPAGDRIAVSTLCCLNPDGMTDRQVRTTSRTLLVDPTTNQSADLFPPGEATHSLDYSDDGTRVLWVDEHGRIHLGRFDEAPRTLASGIAIASW